MYVQQKEIVFAGYCYGKVNIYKSSINERAGLSRADHPRHTDSAIEYKFRPTNWAPINYSLIQRFRRGVANDIRKM